MERDRWPGYLMMLMYSLTTSSDAMSKVDFCVRSIEKDDAPLGEYLEAVRAALASGEAIGPTLGLEHHSEASLREFLLAVEQRLAARVGA
jgi:hypothetical protein